ncbi:ABC-three component system middle component 2 [Nocardioides sp. NPDC047086]|uniref:ABC-three component system middle component 2 n=1 Tax=Nocardioides sp. NPDC047086 TaxID=3154810 RepID=UPI0033BFD6F2
MNPLNSPLEVGLRVLMLLQEVFPQHLDLNQLVLLDHSLLHSADLGGPDSLHPAAPIRAGELGVKREAIEAGLEVMVRAELAQAGVGDSGIEFWASESADGFTNLLETAYASQLHLRATWVVDYFGTLDEQSLRSALSSVVTHWSEEFTPLVEEELY